jgi:hypothetical protein
MTKQQNISDRSATEVNVALEVLPFGSGVCRVAGEPSKKQASKPAAPHYIGPLNTNVEGVQVVFGGGTYSVPKTSSGS